MYPTVYNRMVNKFEVSTPTGLLKFKQSPSGLYYNDVRENEVVLATIEDGINSRVIPTVEENESFFTKRQRSDARRARCTLVMTGRPSTRDFTGMVSNNGLCNCPVTVADIKKRRNNLRTGYRVSDWEDSPVKSGPGGVGLHCCTNRSFKTSRRR